MENHLLTEIQNNNNNKIIKNMQLSIHIITNEKTYDISLLDDINPVNIMSSNYNTPTIKLYSNSSHSNNSEILEDIPKKFYYEWLSTNPISLEEFEESVKYQNVYIYSRVGSTSSTCNVHTGPLNSKYSVWRGTGCSINYTTSSRIIIVP